jgi:hypothetical protein
MSLCTLAFAGCAATHKTALPSASPVATAAQGDAEPIKFITTAGNPSQDELPDNSVGIRHEEGGMLMQLDIYQLTVPFGSLSNDDRFWKHIDEDHVDLAAHELLQMNGMRYGIAPNSEWRYFKSLMDREGATSHNITTFKARKGLLELPLSSGIESQNIFFVNKVNDQVTVSGRSYEKCANLLSLSFEPTPRRAGDARIAVCAMVRGERLEYRPSVLNELHAYELHAPEYLYDLRLREDVPVDHFLVIAPAPLATLPDNVGHTFFVRAGGPQPLETILLLVPRPIPVLETARPAMKFKVSDGKKPPITSPNAPPR